MNDGKELISTRNLSKYYPLTRGMFSSGDGVVRAVDDVTLSVTEGETLGLVGESGCGKSTLGRLLLRLEEPTRGHIVFDGRDITEVRGKALKSFRRMAQLVFQDPYSSLNPRKRVSEILQEPLIIHRLFTRKRERLREVRRLLTLVGLEEDHLDRYAHEFSGGQRQRIGIARALALNPRFIVADEPVSALDVSIRAQILNLLQELQNRFHLAYLLISHDLNVVRYVSQRVAVMYLGKIVEMAPRDELYASPLHPYTQALLRAVPQPTVRRHGMPAMLKGDPSSAVTSGRGCSFYPRCPKGRKDCTENVPALREVASGHYVRCVLLDAKG